jgi:mono/diheme cytochrome c family protein
MNLAMPSSVRKLLLTVVALLLAVAAAFAADGSWLKHVPEADRSRANPFAGQADAVAAGGLVFADRCAKCHGANAEGRGKRPSLRSTRVQEASDGDIFWLLKNGNLAKGMPTWNPLPEDVRWQLIAYIKSLGVSGAPDHPASQPQGER